jgi:orotidine-5'-phosphate decarboxylase
MSSLQIAFPSPSASSASAKERLIIALDVPSAAEAQKLVLQIGDAAVFYKVGFQLFTVAGPDFVRELASSGKKIFLDLKVHEIPNTAAAAVKSAASLNVQMVTVHASGGSKMLRAAVEAATSAGQTQGKDAPVILAVTVLTSLANEDLPEIGLNVSAREQAVRLAKVAHSAGCGGVVASPEEIGAIRNAVGGQMLIVTPGIRPTGSDKGDQSRIATPVEAIRSGATHLVVGRPITKASDPAEAARNIVSGIAEAK